MTENTNFDPDKLIISPLDELDPLELRVEIVNAQERFWGDRDLSGAHEPHWFRQFAAGGLVARYQNEVVGYLLGAFPKEGPSYIHLVAARQDYRHLGIGRRLYEAFIARAHANGEHEVQATAIAENANAIAFHSSLGFEGTRIEDYAGPGEDRVFFTLRLANH
ncbi:GNAT family N-acetyltransferase [Brevibacterium jeotgali]|uniref:Acetyltransferase (GNAT) family protein n=1 Tax=Brevibacterium jeotgali TaxID=1262550 RepID=A0A2H1L0R2_9MICO|nr:GNAT family N-acetyltransferase [Brevibacterium jeotgali]TWC02212.1 acetyltransferase (GNAT) family protein [Brevibacterium jeotgali]SMY10439.1 Acetyltransferase (GNAT) family protein [Brevibacterium jeotgali]